MSEPHAVLDHPSNPKLRGPVFFKVPDLYTTIAIERRITELANMGRDPELPKIHPTELTAEGFVLCVKIATLEHVIHTAPAGLYRVVNGRTMLTPGALIEFENETAEGVIGLLYAAYQSWRERFRDQYRNYAARNDQNAKRHSDSAGGEAGGTRPAGGTGDSEGSPDDTGCGDVAVRADEPA